MGSEMDFDAATEAIELFQDDFRVSELAALLQHKHDSTIALAASQARVEELEEGMKIRMETISEFSDKLDAAEARNAELEGQLREMRERGRQEGRDAVYAVAVAEMQKLAKNSDARIVAALIAAEIKSLPQPPEKEPK